MDIHKSEQQTFIYCKIILLLNSKTYLRFCGKRDGSVYLNFIVVLTAIPVQCLAKCNSRHVLPDLNLSFVSFMVKHQQFF
jgi:hypothetical protein